MTNTGVAILVVAQVTVTGTDAGSFTAAPDTDCAALPGGGTCTIPGASFPVPL